MKVCVFTLGCKVNEVESGSFMSALKSWGAEVESRLCPADIYVLNTCAVTREAEKKSRQLIARARRYNPQAKIFVCGCAAEKDAAAFRAKNVSYVGGAQHKNAVLSALAELFGAAYPCTDNEQGYENMPAPASPRTRAFIKIEDGCNNFCSYCVIPYLRGRVRSRAPEEIVAEVASCGCPEAVLTGINISAYSYDGKGLAGLISALGGVEKRIRLGSVECGVVDEEFLTTCRNLKDFAQQFHLSLQSGSDEVLKKMNRRYTRAQYLEKCALIYKFFPDAAITTDIIAGFPGETEQDFEQSLSIIGEAGFARVHAFAFSPREGTVAFRMKDTPHEVKEERLHRLLQAGAEAENKFIERNMGTVQRVIFEDMEGDYTAGYTGSYIKVYCKGDLRGKVCDVRLVGRYSEGALGELA